MNRGLSQYLLNKSAYRSWGFSFLLCILVIILQYAIDVLINYHTFFYSELYREGIAFFNFLTITKTRIAIHFILGLVIIFLTFLKPPRLLPIPPKILFIIRGIIFVLVWSFGFYEYNYYLDNWHLEDRLIFVLLGIWSWKNPYILPFFIIQYIVLTFQFNFPVFKYSHTDKIILIDILRTFFAFYIVKQFFSQLNWQLLFVIILGIIGAWYVSAGIGKFKIDWYQNNNLYYIFAAAFEFGWLQHWKHALVVYLGDFLYKYHFPLAYCTLVVEVFIPLVILFHRRLFFIGVLSYIFFHLLVFLTTGIFFWKWIFIEVLLLISINKGSFLDLFNIKKGFWLIYLSLLLFIIPKFYSINQLAWLDCGYLSNFYFYLKNDKEKVKLDASFFTPYDFPFAQNRFYYLIDQSVISMTYGSCTDQKLLNLVKDKKETFDFSFAELLKTEIGNNHHKEEKSEKFKCFLTKFVNTKLEKDFKSISLLDAPMHIYQGNNQQNFSFSHPKQLIIYYEEKVVHPHLRMETIQKDSIIIEL